MAMAIMVGLADEAMISALSARSIPISAPTLLGASGSVETGGGGVLRRRWHLNLSNNPQHSEKGEG